MVLGCHFVIGHVVRIRELFTGRTAMKRLIVSQVSSSDGSGVVVVKLREHVIVICRIFSEALTDLQHRKRWNYARKRNGVSKGISELGQIWKDFQKRKTGEETQVGNLSEIGNNI